MTASADVNCRILVGPTKVFPDADIAGKVAAGELVALLSLVRNKVFVRLGMKQAYCCWAWL